MVAEMNGGKDGPRRRIEHFVASMMAGKGRRAAVLTQIRREQASGLPLRRYRYCTAETGRAAVCVIPLCRRQDCHKNY